MSVRRVTLGLVRSAVLGILLTYLSALVIMDRFDHGKIFLQAIVRAFDYTWRNQAEATVSFVPQVTARDGNFATGWIVDARMMTPWTRYVASLVSAPVGEHPGDSPDVAKARAHTLSLACYVPPYWSRTAQPVPSTRAEAAIEVIAGFPIKCLRMTVTEATVTGAVSFRQPDFWRRWNGRHIMLDRSERFLVPAAPIWPEFAINVAVLGLAADWLLLHAVLPACRLGRRIVFGVRHGPGQCRSCGYPVPIVDGVAAAVCPECGKPPTTARSRADGRQAAAQAAAGTTPT